MSGRGSRRAELSDPATPARDSGPGAPSKPLPGTGSRGRLGGPREAPEPTAPWGLCGSKGAGRGARGPDGSAGRSGSPAGILRPELAAHPLPGFPAPLSNCKDAGWFPGIRGWPPPPSQTSPRCGDRLHAGHWAGAAGSRWVIFCLDLSENHEK